MRIHTFEIRVVFCFLLIAAAMALSSCDGSKDPCIKSYLDYPPQGAEFMEGNPVLFRIRSYNVCPEIKFGEYKVTANGEYIWGIEGQYANNWLLTPVSNALIEFLWEPEQQGEYTIEFMFEDNGQEVIFSHVVDISVLTPKKYLVEDPDLTITDLSLEETDRVRCDYRNLEGQILSLGSDVWMDIYVGETEADMMLEAHTNLGLDQTFLPGTSGYVTSPPLTGIKWPKLVRCVIDSEEDIAETDETNNEMTLSLAPPTPSTLRGRLNKDAFCREGPGTIYNAVTVLNSGEEVTLKARSETGQYLWWYVYDAVGDLYCWLSSSVVDTDVTPKSLAEMASPATPTPTVIAPEKLVCQTDLSKDDCEKAGGSWYEPVAYAGDPYCICPED